MTLDQIWTAALGELSLQMTKATFDTWVASTEALQWENGNFVVGVPDAFKRDWLDNRLKTTIERTLQGIVDQPVRVTLLVSERQDPSIEARPKLGLEPGTVSVKFYQFDPMSRGFLMMPKYCEWFWQPVLGVVPYACYRFFRSLDRQNEGWGGWNFVTVERIAATLGVNRQAITGVKRKTPKGREYWQKGAFDGLAEAAIARTETLGSDPKNVSYRVSCLHSLPLLVPTQVETLPEVLQVEHARFLKECDIEFEEWQQLELPTLVQP